MTLRAPIGIEDFRALRQRGLVYVDKSELIRALVDDVGIDVLLLPRRFGKSLGLSMLRKLLQVLFDQHRHLLDSASPREARDLQAILDGDAGREVYERALIDLCTLLHRHSGEQVVILIDEYSVQGRAHRHLARGPREHLLRPRQPGGLHPARARIRDLFRQP